jgi:vacuolar-type H+-ATPase subunit I/STV1
MPKYSILFGLILIVYGVAFYVTAGALADDTTGSGASITALIPSFVGIILLVLGIISACKESLRKHLMHLAALLALLGMIGSAPGLWKIIQTVQGKGELERPMAAFAQTGMFLLLLIFLILCIRSFVTARLLKKK